MAKIEIIGKLIAIQTHNEVDYISLLDIVKNIEKWL
jgi:hypothetical protein